MSGIFNFKEFLTLTEVSEYLADNNYPRFNRARIITLVKDLINENKLSVAVYYKGDVGTELVYREKDKVNDPDRTCYINTYAWLDFNTAHALFQNDSTIEKGISRKDITQGRFNLTPNIKDYKSTLDHENEAYYCYLFIENEDYTLTLDSVRYYRPDLDELFNKQADTQAQIAQLAIDYDKAQAKIANLESQLAQTSAEQIDAKSNIEHGNEGQGDTLLILGAVMQCIKSVAKNNYTKQSLIDAIIKDYPNTKSISQSTLGKKFARAKNHLNQNVTP
jgi:cell division protein FtsB